MEGFTSGRDLVLYLRECKSSHEIKNRIRSSSITCEVCCSMLVYVSMVGKERGDKTWKTGVSRLWIEVVKLRKERVEMH